MRRRKHNATTCGSPQPKGKAPPVEETIAERIAGLYADVDRHQAVVRAYLSVPCRPGCFYCCKQFAPATVAEGVAVVAWMEQQPREWWEDIYQKMNEWWSRYFREVYPKVNPKVEGGADVRPEAVVYLEAGLFCPFLVDGRCGIYPVRPILCRTYFGRVGGGAERCGESATEPVYMDVTSLGYFHSELEAFLEEIRQVLLPQTPLPAVWRHAVVGLVGAWAPLPIAVCKARAFFGVGTLQTATKRGGSD